MPALHVRLFGCPGVSHDGTTWLRQRTRAAEALLGYLALNGERLHDREKLAALIWPEAPVERARGAFKTTLWRLRARLEPEGVARGTFVLATAAGEVGLNWASEIRCDARDFRAEVRPALPAGGGAPCPERLAVAVALCRGELMEGFYDNWIVSERERLRAMWAEALALLMHEADRAGDWERALEFGQRILADDPLRESVHREVARCHLRLGRRVQALRQYQTCAELLRTELGIEPMPETQALLPLILQGTAGGPETPDAGAGNGIAAAARDVEVAMRQLGAARAHLAHEVRLAVERSGPVS